MPRLESDSQLKKDVPRENVWGYLNTVAEDTCSIVFPNILVWEVVDKTVLTGCSANSALFLSSDDWLPLLPCASRPLATPQCWVSPGLIHSAVISVLESLLYQN